MDDTKKLSEEHKKKLSESVRLWWEINKRDNPDFVKQRNENVKQSLLGKRLGFALHPPIGKSPRHKGTSIHPDVYCVVCGNICPRRYARENYGRHRFCSVRCYRAYLPGSGWHQIHPKADWTAKVLKQAVGKCEKCGFSDIRILMVHHINRDRTDNHRENLLVLCPNCHILQHLNSCSSWRYWQRYWARWLITLSRAVEKKEW